MASSTEPVYLRVLEDLRTRIREGVLEPGARIPSRNAIMARYGVGETAAKHALQVLAAEGLIEGRPGSGSYVRRIPLARHLEHDRPHFPGSPFGIEEQDAAGAHQLRWEHRTEHAVPPAHISRRLGLAAGLPVTVTRYLLTADAEPVQLAVSYEPSERTEGTPVALPEQGPFAGRGVIERMHAIGVQVDQVVEDLRARPALLAEATALGLPAGAMVLVVERTHLAGEQPVETGEIVIAADRFRLRYRFDVARPPGDHAGTGDHEGSRDGQVAEQAELA